MTYSQYVVRRSSRLEFGEALAVDRVRTVEGVDLPLHWNEEEFAPIDTEIERLCRRLGWRRT